ncbi:hypothetical protein FJTKL_10124 [Diaporthe vaccinii]|uniref:Uncharacterized protein n=1 Tax=Diaporthe vaccinii TaxID=105482 RepID=A0ABR4ELE8_9PEZI
MSYGYRRFWSPWNWFDSRGSSIQSSHQSSSRRTSSATSTASDRHGGPQVIRGSWIDESKLKELLEKKYRGDYKLRMRNNKYELYFPQGQGLTQQEINYCY